jgi:hypothetical protein
VAAGQRRRGQRTGGLPGGWTRGGRRPAVLKQAVLKSAVPKQAVPKSAVPRWGAPKSGGRRQGDRHGTGHGPPVAQPARRRHPALRGRGHPAHRDPSAGRRPARGRPDAGGNLRRRDLRHRCQAHVRQSGGRPSDRGLPPGHRSRPGRPDRCQAHGGRWSGGCPRGCGRGRAGRCSRPRGHPRLPEARPPMACVAYPGRCGGSRCGPRPAWPPGKRPWPVRHPFRGRLQLHGRHPFPGWLQVPVRHPFRGGLQLLGRQPRPVRHRFRGTYPFRVRHSLRCPGRGDSRPRCHSARQLSPGSGNRTLPGHAARVPRRGGCPTCWRGGPCFRCPRPVRYRSGLRHYHRAGPSQCCRPGRGPWRPYGHDQRRRWSGPGSAVLRRPGSDRAPRRRIGRHPGPARLPRSVLRSS